MARWAPLLLLVLTLMWGTSWTTFPLITREVSVWTFRASTMPVAGTLLLVLMHLRGVSCRVPRRHWPLLAFTACCYLALWNISTTLAATLIPTGQAALLGFTMPLWAALLSWLLFRQTLDGRQWLALLLGAGGILLLMWPAFEAYASAPLGMALGLTAGCGWALATILLKHRPIPVPAPVLTGWQLLVASVPIVLGALWRGDHQWFMPSATTLGLFAYNTLFPTMIGNLLWFTLIRWLPPVLLSLSPIMVPMVAMLAGAWLLHEPLGLHQWLAMALSASSLALMLFRRS